MMTTVSFKTDDSLKETLEFLAKQHGINLSAMIKMLLTHGVQNELSRVTGNGITVAEELEILKTEADGDFIGPFESAGELIRSLRSKD